jgi:hypothetical protein
MKQTFYEIKFLGNLDVRWLRQFFEMTMKVDEDGNTLLIGALPDQSALHGVLNTIRDLNLKLISVKTLEEE